MFPGFDRIIEERIRRAQQKGEFENLTGSGKPLVFKDDGHVAEELRLAYKILKNADCLPPEIELKKEIQQTEALLSGMGETAEKLIQLDALDVKINLEQSNSEEFLKDLSMHLTGKEIIVRGKARYNDYSQSYEISTYDFSFSKIDYEKEAREILEEL